MNPPPFQGTASHETVLGRASVSRAAESNFGVTVSGSRDPFHRVRFDYND